MMTGEWVEQKTRTEDHCDFHYHYLTVNPRGKGALAFPTPKDEATLPRITVGPSVVHLGKTTAKPSIEKNVKRKRYP
jgi:hypothetical protein